MKVTSCCRFMVLMEGERLAFFLRLLLMRRLFECLERSDLEWLDMRGEEVGPEVLTIYVIFSYSVWVYLCSCYYLCSYYSIMMKLSFSCGYSLI